MAWNAAPSPSPLAATTPGRRSLVAIHSALHVVVVRYSPLCPLAIGHQWALAQSPELVRGHVDGQSRKPRGTRNAQPRSGVARSNVDKYAASSLAPSCHPSLPAEQWQRVNQPMKVSR
jgi:hypothetical protein